MSARKMPTLEYAEEMSSRASHASDAEGDDGKETFGFSENSHEYELQDIIDSHWFSEGRDSKRNSKRHSKLGRLGSGSLVKLGSTVSLGKLGSTASLGRLGSAVNLGKLGSTVNLGQSGAAAPSDTKWYSRKDKGKERLKDEDEDEVGSGSDETKVDEKKTEDDTKAVGIFKLFRFGTPLELTMNVFGLVLAAAAGSAQPLMTLFFGNITKAFTEYGATVHTITTGGGGEDMTAELAAAKAHVKHDSARIALWITLIGVGHFVCTYTYMLIWNWTSERQSARLRAAYLKAVLRQEVEYLDHLGAGEVASRIQSDTLLFQIGIGEKMALAVGYVSTFFTGFILAYIRSPRMGGALTSVLPPVVIIGVVMDVSMAYYTGKVLKLTSKAATLAEEALSTIRTVHAFGISERLGKRFDALVETARKVGNTNSNIEGTSIALIYFSIYGAYGLAFYYGGILYLQGKADVSIVINVLLAVVIGSFTLSLITPELQAISRAQAAAGKLFAVIDHVPSIDSASEQGVRLPSVVGDITLEEVHFTYPSRPTIPILKGISLHMEAGKTYALVGASGSGKSTIIQLLERFYDPDRGRLTLDGHDLRTLNVRWLRQQLGLVSQEPTLFSTTVRGNVEQGLVGTPYEFAPDAERLQLVQRACITANAHDFITNLPEGYDTHVGERGMLLSGGQKQRVAIARAIIANPRILLLDEATSALDATAERIVQDALENASRGRTTIIIAHRLSTIKDADCILVMSAGEIIERGTHTELLARQGAYATLVANQKVAGDMKDESADVTPGDLTPSGQHLTGGPSKADLLRLQSTLSLGLHEDKEKRIGFARLFIRLIKLGRGRYLWYFSGLVGAICVGVSYAAVAILFGKSIADFEGTDKFAVKKALSKKGLWYLVVALSTCFVAWFQNTPFSNMGWNTSSKLRSMGFRSLMRHDIQWFDEHEAGPATATLSEDPQKVQGLFGMTLGQIIGAMATIVSGMIVGLAYAPILAAVGIACMPLIFSAGYIRLRVVDLKDQRARKIYSKSTLLATEAAGAIRTIASLTREKDVLTTYVASLRDAERTSIRLAWGSQALFASSQAVSYFSIALVFWSGSIWLADGKFTSEKFFICIEAVIFATIQAGSMFMFVPDASRAGSASRALFKILDNKPTVDSDSKDGITVDPKQVRGDVRFNNVTFRYPSRPGVRVLKHLSLEIPAGKYVALVGPSGCGKSTTIQLIERFYDPLGGSITLDGVDIRKLNVRSYRSAIALVSQEPTLYSGNIRFNILLGAIDPDAITEQQLVQACKDANIFDFIMSLPNGFETEVGGKGVQLSGGQKQRLAIARALIRNPRVLLLDEATAALDSASERIVQAALDNASEGRSVLAIAHRVSTIQNADIIYYISEGDVLEKGTHQELLALRGAYYDLVQMQALVHT